MFNLKRWICFYIFPIIGQLRPRKRKAKTEKRKQTELLCVYCVLAMRT